MQRTRNRAEELLRAVVHEVRVEKLTFVAGSIAYHAFISILPLMLLVLTLVQRTQNTALQDSIVGVMQAVLTAEASAVIQQGLTEADASVSLLGAAFLVWGAMRIFRGLDTAFSDIYETESENTFADQLGDGLVLLVTVTLAIVAASVIGSSLPVIETGLVGVGLRALATIVGLFLVFYPMYYIFPDTDVAPLEIVPGTAFAAVGIAIAQAVFTLFKSGATGGNLVASILVLLTWLYVIGLLLLIGAAINAVFSNRSSDVDVDPVFGGVPRRSDRDDSTVDRSELLGRLDSVAETLAETESGIAIQFDGGSRVELSVPHTASVDRRSGVFGLDKAVSLTLYWWTDESATDS
ncbi:ribonuclease BN-like protein [Halorubrum aidingense JCM 13560]|uniref:Ribonuclease BN-like protein n=1 Tax=Halorubrum aidingense JCM 13560 TaxID=1230454 RepID=M0P715_9EURY|nr:YihY/virulence factor BrkB family protein [Halorubrum aidingense]EMA65329.1 ribonuclease BN-like protein [Halorubrum aidingense JCM 13560]